LFATAHILLILLIIACTVFNCVLLVFNKEYDDDAAAATDIQETAVAGLATSCVVISECALLAYRLKVKA